MRFFLFFCLFLPISRSSGQLAVLTKVPNFFTKIWTSGKSLFNKIQWPWEEKSFQQLNFEVEQLRKDSVKKAGSFEGGIKLYSPRGIGADGELWQPDKKLSKILELY